MASGSIYYASHPWSGRVCPIPTRVSTTPEALADREARKALQHQDLTARLLGDPLPGRSAADLPRHKAPSVVPDPLDRLVFRRVSIRG